MEMEASPTYKVILIRYPVSPNQSDFSLSPDNFKTWHKFSETLSRILVVSGDFVTHYKSYELKQVTEQTNSGPKIGA